MTALRQIILQQKQHDCGVACTAMLLGVEYHDAEALFITNGLNNKRKPFSSNVTELTKVLTSTGAKVKRQVFKSWASLVTPCIAKTLVDANGNWHWVVIDRHPEFGIYIADPSPQCPLPAYEYPTSGVDCIDINYYQPNGSCLSLIS